MGTNDLIKQGAKLVSSIDDTIEEFNLVTKPRRNRIKNVGGNPESCLAADEAALYSLISKDPVFLDDIIEKSNLEVSVASDMLLRLQLKKLIKQLPGVQFVKN